MDIRKIKKLIEMLQASDLNEIEIQEGEESVRISRGSTQPIEVKSTPVELQNVNTVHFFSSSHLQYFGWFHVYYF